MATRRAAAGRKPRLDPEQIGEQILEAFSARAKLEGIRRVMMGDLARELRMSASTLYKLFPSKEALVLACVDRWAEELAAPDAATPNPAEPRDGFEQFMHWAEVWAEKNAALSPAFARDLRSDYPEGWKRFGEVVRAQRARGVELLRPLLKPGLDERVAFAVLGLIMDAVLRPDFAGRLRISQKEAIRSAVSIWAAGAVGRSGRLRALESKQQRAPARARVEKG